MTNAVTKSPKTTAFGVLSGLSLVIPQIMLYFDGDPATTPSWGIIIFAIMTALGLSQARDNDVTSKSAGAEQ